MSRFHRTPAPGAPWGFSDLPVELGGEITDGLFPAFVPHVSPHDVDELTKPWHGRHAHPRCAIARAVIRSSIDVELGWRAAVELVGSRSSLRSCDTSGRTSTPEYGSDGVAADHSHVSGLASGMRAATS